MATGTVKWFNDAKGYGFITPRTARRISSSTSATSPATASRRSTEGAKVEFEAREGAKGPEATNVAIISA